MILSDRHHFHFFHNREMDSLYLTLALLYFAEGLISVFVPIYFWNLGMPLWQIIFFYFLNAAFFVAFTLFLLPVIKKLSDKMMMFLSIPFLVLYFLGLGYIDTQFTLFYVLPALLALNMLLFNLGYHINFSGAADDGYVGREVGFRYMIGALVQFASPFIGGVIITAFGFQQVFFIGSVLLFLCVLPMFFFPQRRISTELETRLIFDFMTDKHLQPLNISAGGYGIESMITRFVWPIFIFISIGSIEAFGGLISASLLASAIVTYFVGFLSDSGKRRKILSISSLIMSFVWILRPLSAVPAVVASSHIVGNLSNASMMVAWSSQYYKVARLIKNSPLFILSREVLFNITRIFFLPILMLMAYFMPQGLFFSVSFVVAAGATMLIIVSNRMDYKLLQ